MGRKRGAANTINFPDIKKNDFLRPATFIYNPNRNGGRYVGPFDHFCFFQTVYLLLVNRILKCFGKAANVFFWKLAAKYKFNPLIFISSVE